MVEAASRITCSFRGTALKQYLERCHSPHASYPTHAITHSPTHSITHWLSYTLAYILINILIYLLVHLISNWINCPIVRSLNHSFADSVTLLINHSFNGTFIHSLNCLFMTQLPTESTALIHWFITHSSDSSIQSTADHRLSYPLTQRFTQFLDPQFARLPFVVVPVPSHRTTNRNTRPLGHSFANFGRSEVTSAVVYFLHVSWLYTGRFTTLGHNCRRSFPRSLWSKKFI
jgi:hypothetical protein